MNTGTILGADHRSASDISTIYRQLRDHLVQPVRLVLLIVGLVISVPLIVAGSAVIMALLGRLPLLVWAGAALLGWVAGEIVLEHASRAFAVRADPARTFKELLIARDTMRLVKGVPLP